MTGVGVEEKKIVTVKTTDGQEIKPGDILLLSVKGQDIICRFKMLDGNSYFTTAPVVTGEGATQIRYRLPSIATCFKVKSFEVDAPEETLREAAKEATDAASRETPAAEA